MGRGRRDVANGGVIVQEAIRAIGAWRGCVVWAGMTGRKVPAKLLSVFDATQLLAITPWASGSLAAGHLPT